MPNNAALDWLAADQVKECVGDQNVQATMLADPVGQSADIVLIGDVSRGSDKSRAPVKGMGKRGQRLGRRSL